MSDVKGSAIAARVRFVRERFGDEGYARLVASVDDASRARLAGRILAHEWVPFALFRGLNVEADRLFGKGDLQLCYEMGRYSAEVNLPSLYRLFYRLRTPMFIFRKAARLWDVHYTSGKLTPIEERAGAIRLEIEGFAEPHRAHCMSVLGWAARSGELSGGRLRQAEETRCRTRGDAVCVLTLDWG
jgi:hypothetical protein